MRTHNTEQQSPVRQRMNCCLVKQIIDFIFVLDNAWAFFKSNLTGKAYEKLEALALSIVNFFEVFTESRILKPPSP